MIWVAALAFSFATAGVPGAAKDTLARYEFVEPHMGTLFRIVMYARSDGEARGAADAAFVGVRELNAVFSDYDSTSEARRITRAAIGMPVQVSPDMARVLEFSREVWAESGGAFDVTVGPVVHLWRRARATRALPSDDVREDALRRVGMVHVRMDGGSVRLMRRPMSLDFGGIAKGVAADEALKVLRARGIVRAMVAAGGDIAVGDAPPGKDAWEIALPTGETRRVVRRGVSTSGDSEQFVEIGGVRFSHIVDPRTGLGITHGREVTVIAGSAMESDALATAFVVMDTVRGRAVARRRGVEMIVREKKQ